MVTDNRTTQLNAEQPSAPRLRLLTFIAAAVACAVVFVHLGDYRTLTTHEGFAAVPAREMLATGDWVVPQFGALPRLQKPPVIYWAIAAVDWCTGRIDEWTARLPSALSALALAGLMGYWASRWYGAIVGRWVALVQGSCAYVVIFGRSATVDMLLCLIIVLALWVFAGHEPTESRRRTVLRWTGLYALLGLSWLSKFHYGPAMILAPIVCFCVVERRFRPLLNFLNPWGIAISVACVVVWPWLVLQRLPDAWQIWWYETVGRAAGEHAGDEPIWFYLPQVIYLVLPWTPFAIRAVPTSWRDAWLHGQSRERFLWIWFLSQLAIVSLASNRHGNYVIPALPVFSIFAGRTLAALHVRVLNNERLFSSRYTITTIATVMLAGAIGYVVLSTRWPELSTIVAATLGTVVVSVTLATLLFFERKERWASCTLVVGFIAAYSLTMGHIVPRQDHRLAAAQFGRKMRQQVGTDEICVYRLDQVENHMDPVVFYLGTPVRRFETTAPLRDKLHKHGAVYTLAYMTSTDELEQLGTLEDRHTMSLAATQRPPKHPLFVMSRMTPKSDSHERADGVSDDNGSGMNDSDSSDSENPDTKSLTDDTTPIHRLAAPAHKNALKVR